MNTKTTTHLFKIVGKLLAHRVRRGAEWRGLVSADCLFWAEQRCGAEAQFDWDAGENDWVIIRDGDWYSFGPRFFFKDLNVAIEFKLRFG